MIEYLERPDFNPVEHGTCELCGAEDVDLDIISPDIRVCEECMDNDVDFCEVCGEFGVSAEIEHTYTEDGHCICAYCMEDLDEEDGEEDDDEE